MRRLLAALVLAAGITLSTVLPATAGPRATCSNPLFDSAAAYAGWPVREIPKVGRVAWRESRCVPTARNRVATGLMQIHRIHLGWLGLTRADLEDPFINLQAGYAVWLRQGWGAWSSRAPTPSSTMTSPNDY